jgi:hypothetical protein
LGRLVVHIEMLEVITKISMSENQLGQTLASEQVPRYLHFLLTQNTELALTGVFRRHFLKRRLGRNFEAKQILVSRL